MTAVADPYEHTATGILGNKRDTMLHNELILRGELGKPMTRGYTSYPGETVRYGRPNISIDGGASEALRGWSTGIYFPQGGKDGGAAERDFMALNRAAVLAGLTTASEQYQYRATHDIRRSLNKEEGNKSKTRRLPATMVYGVSTRPSTPIHDLLEHRYQDKWLQEHRTSNLSASQSAIANKLGTGKFYHTRASLLRNYQVPVQEPALWQMPKFTKNALPHLETFRSAPARVAALKHYQSDCISRRGVQGHGIYEQAKN